jgi:hypothetical protein
VFRNGSARPGVEGFSPSRHWRDLAGLARSVKELQAESLAVLQRLADREAVAPVGQKQPQVDIGPENDAVRARYLDVVEASVALVHAMLVAREAHDAADRRHLRQDRSPVRGKRRRRPPDAQRDQPARRPQRRGGIADA